MNQERRGFCVHQKVIPGLDACFCYDCRKWFLPNTPGYDSIINRSKSGKKAKDK